MSQLLHVEGFASVLCIILGGAVIAALALWIYRIGIFILCFTFAFSAAGTLFSFEGDIQFFINIIAGLIVGVLAVKYMRPVIILTSAIVCGSSAAGLLPGVAEYMGITKFSSTNSSATLTLALCILGIAVQFLTDMVRSRAYFRNFATARATMPPRMPDTRNSATPCTPTSSTTNMKGLAAPLTDTRFCT